MVHLVSVKYNPSITMNPPVWHQSGHFAKHPIELTVEIWSFVHPVYEKIYCELEKLNRTMPNIERFYLDGRILPNNANPDIYDPKTCYQVHLPIDNFMLLGKLVILNQLLLTSIDRFPSNRHGIGMHFKHHQEAMLKMGYISVRGDHFKGGPMSLYVPGVYVSRELTILSLYVCGWKYITYGHVYVPCQLREGEVRLNQNYFACEVTLTKERLVADPNFIKINYLTMT